MMRSLFSGVAGLRTHQTKMDVIGNNIANVNTTAYKSQSVTFRDLMYQTTQKASGANAATGAGGKNAKQIGLGSTTGAINTAITQQGSAQTTNNPFDIMITGSSFFVVNDGKQNYFTRDGSFYIDGAGNLAMTSTGYNVMGWQVDPTTGQPKADTVSALRVMNEANMKYPPEATSEGRVTGIIDKNDSKVNSSSGRIMNMEFYDNKGYKYTAKLSMHSTSEDGSYYVALDDIVDASGKSVGPDILNNVSFGNKTLPVDVSINYSPNNMTVVENGKVEVTATDGVTKISAVNGIKQQVKTADIAIIEKIYGVTLTDADEIQITKDGKLLVTGGSTYSIKDGKAAFTADSPATVTLTDKTTPTKTQKFFTGTEILASDDTTAALVKDYYGIDVKAEGIVAYKINSDGTLTVTKKNVKNAAEVEFDRNTGAFKTVNGNGQGTMTLGFGGDTPFNDINIDFSTIQNLNNGGSSTISAKNGKEGGEGSGRMIGEMSEMAIDKNGLITANYDNGMSRVLGQIAVASFANASGLEKSGNNLYSATMNSGAFDGVGIEIAADGGEMNSGVLEMSNVDLSAEFTEMITTQRGFQANSRIITVSDTMLEELTNLKR